MLDSVCHMTYSIFFKSHFWCENSRICMILSSCHVHDPLTGQFQKFDSFIHIVNVGSKLKIS